ncbi:glucokinase [Desulfofustis glycolicus]|uniref:Glucokinase n=1 Tax=Desulfofustis glycolicus DSM 9705 TaxID=1121409 RepID=A0A1M5S4A0_9BACT|nr:glucokinase [Desulfofustis glycolicus]MCB2216253.1 glucokinase [Desulfobulbaceae bacterium]SHH32783.1 glucokinase [Desulfofustis glycolicus DSM 9705]
MKSILAADIGGTNSRFAVFQKSDGKPLSLLTSRWLPTKDADSFAKLLTQLADSNFPLTPATADITVIGVAGPVRQGRYCNPPNIDWDIDLARPQDRADAQRVELINDFVAQAYACSSPVGQTARVIIPGEPVSGGTVGVLGAGTALGKAILVPQENTTALALPSEGGHAYFPFIGERECAFQRFYQQNSGQHHITGNLVVSGRGLRYLHWFLTGEDLSPEQVTVRFTGPSETLAWAARFYGRVCRDFALEVLAQGGLYIAGGVAAKSPTIVTHEEFRREFTDSPTMGQLLSRLPVYLLENEESGLWGAAYLGELSLRHG